MSFVWARITRHVGRAGGSLAFTSRWVRGWYALCFVLAFASCTTDFGKYHFGADAGARTGGSLNSAQGDSTMSNANTSQSDSAAVDANLEAGAQSDANSNLPQADSAAPPIADSSVTDSGDPVAQCVSSASTLASSIDSGAGGPSLACLQCVCGAGDACIASSNACTSDCWSTMSCAGANCLFVTGGMLDPMCLTTTCGDLPNGSSQLMTLFDAHCFQDCMILCFPSAG